MRSCVLLAATMMVPASVAAEQARPAVIEAFFLAGNAHIQERHEVQITWSLEHARQDEVSADDIDLEVEYGITNRLQLEVGLPWQRVHPSGEAASSGFGNLGIGFMYALAQGPRRLLSAGLDLGLPTAEGDEGGATQIQPFVIAGHSIGRGETHASASYGLDASHDVAWNVAGVAPFRKWRGTLELNGRRVDRTNSIRITPGVMWKGWPGYEVGVAMPVGLHDAPRAGVVVLIDASF